MSDHPTPHPACAKCNDEAERLRKVEEEDSRFARSARAWLGDSSLRIYSADRHDYIGRLRVRIAFPYTSGRIPGEGVEIEVTQETDARWVVLALREYAKKHEPPKDSEA